MLFFIFTFARFLLSCVMFDVYVSAHCLAFYCYGCARCLVLRSIELLVRAILCYVRLLPSFALSCVMLGCYVIARCLVLCLMFTKARAV